MDYRDVIKPNKVDGYIKYHKKFFTHILDINTDVFFMEKIMNFPFKQLKLPYQALFYYTINSNIFQNLVVKLHRLLNDTSSDVFTLMKFKNNIIKIYIKDDFKLQLIENIKQSDLNQKKYLDIREKIKTARNEFLAHRNIKYFIDDDPEDNLIEFEDIKELTLRINDFFKVISFNVDDKYDTKDYFTLEIRRAIVETFNHIVDENMMSTIINSDYLDGYWELDKSQLTGGAKNVLDSFIRQVANLKLD